MFYGRFSGRGEGWGIKYVLEEEDVIKIRIMKDWIYLLAGTYTKGESRGIYIYRFDTISGSSEYVGIAAVENPSYLAASHDGRFIYAVSENEEEPAYANSFRFDRESGELRFLNRKESHGAAPCNITADGRYVLTANYGGGTVTVFPLDADGSLAEALQVVAFKGSGADPERQERPHPHCVKFSPDGRFLFATDLGTDRIYRFELSGGKERLLKSETMEMFSVTEGSGPRHLVFHPSGRYLYLINELAGTVTAFDYRAATGELEEFQTVHADSVGARGSGDIVITPDGRFLYASNRLKNDGVAVFSIDQATGKLTKTAYFNTGIHPRNLAVTPNGEFLLVASMESNRIEVFRIDKQNGLPENTRQDILLDQPVCILFMERG